MLRGQARNVTIHVALYAVQATIRHVSLLTLAPFAFGVDRSRQDCSKLFLRHASRVRLSGRLMEGKNGLGSRGRIESQNARG